MTETKNYPASALADILFGLSTSLENLQKDDVSEPIPGNNLDEMLIFVARKHPEPAVASYLVHELECLAAND
jgi:hypothetical protein